jgi:hypothetical protein
MIESLRSEVKRMFGEAFAPLLPCLETYFHGVIDTLISASDEIVSADQNLKAKQRNQLNALLKAQSKLEGPEKAEAWKIIDHDARWAFEGCFILVGYLSLSLAMDIRLLDMNRLYQRYPKIMAAVAPGSAEAAVLLEFTNVMKTALLSTKPSGHKAMLIEICVRLSEGASAADKYKRGSGPQTTGSTRREIIFERESGSVPKPCREKREALRLSTALATAGATDNDTPAKRPSPADFETPVRAKQRTTTQPGSISAAGECVLQQVLSSPACEGTSRGAATVSSSIGGITPEQQCVHTLPGGEVQPLAEDVVHTSGMGCSSETETTHSFHDSDEQTIVFEDISDPLGMPWCLSAEYSYSLQDSESQASVEDVFDTSGMVCNSEMMSVLRSFQEGGYVGDDAERRDLQYARNSGVPTAVASQDSGVLGSDYVASNL